MRLLNTLWMNRYSARRSKKTGEKTDTVISAWIPEEDKGSKPLQPEVRGSS
jgi:hypothetical protein